jgi:hypothetical protein
VRQWVGRGVHAYRASGLIAALFAAVACGLIGGQPPPSAEARIAVDVSREIGRMTTRLGTQFVWPGGLDRAAGTRPLFGALAPPVVRINVTTIGSPALMPGGAKQGDWRFDYLDAMVNDIRLARGEVLLTIAYAPDWMWDCSRRTIRDPTFAEFGAYMARLVAYYNAGSFRAEDGRTIRNPSGLTNRITFWEMWNEPDLSTPDCAPQGNHLTTAQYVAMWNATVPRMLAVDPAIKLLGPSTSSAVQFPEYVPALMAGAIRKPDAISFHGYGGWRNSQTDRLVFDGTSDCCGVDAIVRGVALVKTQAPGLPVWITEINVNSAGENDPAKRGSTAYGAAWGASAFRRLTLAGADVILQYQFAHPDLRELSLVDVATGQPLLPYWRDYYLARYFAPGSTIVAAESDIKEVEVLAVRPAGSSNVRVLVVNRRVDGPTSVGGSGLPTTARVRVGNLPGIAKVVARVLDRGTPLETGPASVDLGAAESATVILSGYGVALLEFVAGSPPVSAGR